jgi:hypothetical protein
MPISASFEETVGKGIECKNCSYLFARPLGFCWGYKSKARGFVFFHRPFTFSPSCPRLLPLRPLALTPHCRRLPFA